MQGLAHRFARLTPSEALHCTGPVAAAARSLEDIRARALISPGTCEPNWVIGYRRLPSVDLCPIPDLVGTFSHQSVFPSVHV
ncbi:hypothetical protein PsYK624_018420 [Phanerochaete sordida]|uniref:Uncharacterized protein n=1 Tax=Phanerochaete sordida TaxID=48140 RepID=A0A9P3G032_9APHY|nr:hypothetical protein PsYK624_018420 [Phanerochaete sordida]